MLRSIWNSLKSPVNAAIDSLQRKFPPNRIVVLLTPTVFVPVSTWLSGWAAANLPGVPPLSTAWIGGVMATGALAAIGLAYKWVDGWQKHEAQIAGSPAAAIHKKRHL